MIGDAAVNVISLISMVFSGWQRCIVLKFQQYRGENYHIWKQWWKGTKWCRLNRFWWWPMIKSFTRNEIYKQWTEVLFGSIYTSFLYPKAQIWIKFTQWKILRSFTFDTLHYCQSKISYSCSSGHGFCVPVIPWTLNSCTWVGHCIYGNSAINSLIPLHIIGSQISHIGSPASGLGYYGR